MVNLQDLPEDILFQIHSLSLSPFLPLVHTTIYHTLHSAPKAYIARYLLQLYAAYPPNEILLRAVKHRVCTVAVAREMRRLWDKQRGYVGIDLSEAVKRKGKRRISTDDPVRTEAAVDEGVQEEEDDPPPQPPPTAGPLTCSELPRRLFRGDLTPESPIPPLLEYLMDAYNPSPNSHKGYPLCRAVLTSNIRLIEYLLRRNADPALERALPVRIATQMGRLDLVKLLVEVSPNSVEPIKRPIPSAVYHKPHALNIRKDARGQHAGGKTGLGAGSPSKRPRHGDRVSIGPELVELAMKHGHEHIVRYFVHDKGVMPPLRSIMKLSGNQAGPIKPMRMGSKPITARVRYSR